MRVRILRRWYKQPAAARLSAVAAADCLPTAATGSQSSYTTLWGHDPNSIEICARNRRRSTQIQGQNRSRRPRNRNWNGRDLDTNQHSRLDIRARIVPISLGPVRPDRVFRSANPPLRYPFHRHSVFAIMCIVAVLRYCFRKNPCAKTISPSPGTQGYSVMAGDNLETKHRGQSRQQAHSYRRRTLAAP